jgi:hypothetical protein
VRSVCGLWAGLFALLPASALAQDEVNRFQLKVSGNVNASLGGAVRDVTAVAEGEIQVTPQYRLPSGTILAARAVLGAQGIARRGGSPSSLNVPEISAFAIGSFGRIEAGVRAGFPQSLVGFTPSEIAFTAAEFSPESGARLDPDGRLPTTLLPDSVAAPINALTYLGYAARLYDDRSFKVIYLTPRSKPGFYGAVSYTPSSNRPAGFRLSGAAPGSLGVRNLVQAAALWTRRSEVVDLTVGASWSHARGALSQRIDSISGGINATFQDRWTLGLSATYDGLSTRKAGAAPFGVVASANYVSGPLIIGGYYQHAEAQAQIAGRDSVDIGELGLSYLIDNDHDLIGAGHYTDVKLFANLYRFALRRTDAAKLSQEREGVVFTTGLRFSFF